MAKVAIVGGGITGLTSAYLLAKRGHSVTVFEKEDVWGGLASSFKDPSWHWGLERYYHHIFASDQDVRWLTKDLGLKEKLFFGQPKTSIFLEGKIFQFDNPKSILLFPSLSLVDKLKMGLTTIFLKVNPFWKPLEKITAHDFIRKNMGEKTLRLIWQPLLESKFGSFSKQIPASWFWTRIKKRSFSLGYFQGGTETLINALVKEIKDKGGKTYLKTEIDRIKKITDDFEISVNGKVIPDKFDKVVATVPPLVLPKIFPNLSPEDKEGLKSLKSLGSLCLVFSLKESFLTDGTYWLNVNERHFPFVAVVEHTNLIDKKNYDNKVVLYVGGYYPSGHPLFQTDQRAILQKFLPYLKRINPCFNFENSLINLWLFKDVYSQPVPFLNYSPHRPGIRTSVPNFWWASLHHVYPEDRGLNYAIWLGRQIANEIENS